VRLKVGESVFLEGHNGRTDQFLIWPENVPSDLIDRMTPNKGYVVTCKVENDAISLFVGGIHAKRRQQSSGRDVLVLMLEDMDLGHLSTNAMIELDVAGFLEDKS